MFVLVLYLNYIAYFAWLNMFNLVINATAHQLSLLSLLINNIFCLCFCAIYFN